MVAVALLFWSRAMNAARRLVTPYRFCRSSTSPSRSRPWVTDRMTSPWTSCRCSEAMDLISPTFSCTVAWNTSFAARVIWN
ncbi:hypothetical protein D3C85_1553520 [compost metagenome]